MNQNFSKYHKTSQNVPNVSKSPKTSQNPPKFTQSIQECPKMSKKNVKNVPTLKGSSAE